ncbi:MAG: glycosyltransferase family 4 protein [Phycisphaerae bacterium]|nr:glycosyltransferase family 4 protein [Phycisphaerae bacterium]
MVGVIKKLIKERAEKSLLFRVLLLTIRFVKKVLYGINEFCGIVVAAAIFVVILPILLLFRHLGKPEDCVFFTGLEHIIKKTAERGQWFVKWGYFVRYFSREASNIDSSQNVGSGLIHSPLLVPLDCVLWTYRMLVDRPRYVETYLFSCSFRTVFYLLTCRCMGVFSTIILRGETNPKSNWGIRSWYWKSCLFVSLHLAQKIFHREADNGVDMTLFEKKAIFDHNCTTIHPFEDRDYNDTVLFLNSFKPFRRVELLAQAVKHVVKKRPSVKFMFVGARNEEKHRLVSDILERDGVREFAEIFPFSEKPRDFFEKSSIFVLTANAGLHFVNYSLIEAMERGMVPVLSDCEDAKHFVDHDINGLLVEQNPLAIADAIVKLLSDKDKLKKMGLKSRQKIVDCFNNEKRMQKLLGLINDFYDETDIAK